MNIVQKLTLEYMKKNKSRTLVTIVGVIISVAMIAATSTIAASFMDMLQRSTKLQTGDWQTMFQGVSGLEVEKITGSNQVKNSLVSCDIGFGELKGSKNSQRPYVYIAEYSSFDLFPFKVTQGRLPENENEIVVSDQIPDTSGVKYKIGDKVTFALGNRTVTEDSTTSSVDNYYPYTKEEKFIVTGEREYTITGFVDAGLKEGAISAGYPVFGRLKNISVDKSYTVYTGLKKINRGIYKWSEKMKETAKAQKLGYNNELLLYSGISNDGYFVTTMKLATCLVGIIILLGSVSLIYNAFAISLSERSRTLGMLASVGATKQQKRDSVFFEGFIIGLIAIPIGIICGYFGIGLTFWLINPIIQNLFQSTVPLELVISPMGLAGAVLFSILLLFISAWFPAKRASKITPIDAIRQSQDFNIKKKDIKTSGLTKILFGFEAELGLKNLKRNKHRYHATLISMIISIILFLTASGFSSFIKKSFLMTNAPIQYDVFVSADSMDQDNLDQYIAELRNAANIKKVISTHNFYADHGFDQKFVTADVKKRLQPYDGKYQMQLDIRSMDDESLKEYCKKSGIDYDGLNSGSFKGILINTFTLKEKHEFTTISQLTAKTGDKIPFTFYDDSSKTKEGQLEIAGISDQLPVFMPGYQECIFNMTIIVPEKSIRSFLKEATKEGYQFNYQSQIYYLTGAASTLEKQIETVKANYPGINSYTFNAVANSRKQQSLSLVFSIFLYGFVILIAIVCTANIINTISTGIHIRKREFAMLKSYGITPKGFHKMIRYESIFYGIKSLAYGLPISFALIYLVYKSLSRNFDFRFYIPVDNVIIAVICVFLISGTTMLYAVRKTKKDNIVDTLKNENL